MFPTIWLVSIVALLMCSYAIPYAFSIAIIIFYCPFVVFAFYMMSFIPRDMWMFLGLMCLFLYNL